MANIQLTGLDFHTIKDNLKLFLRDQEVLSDANYEGSALSTLLDILALNTHYNGYYLNMAVNEMFLDTAVKRNSIVSIAKTLGYVPSSTHSCSALISLEFNGVTSDKIIIPKYTKFISKNFDVFYTFLTLDEIILPNEMGKAITKQPVQILEGEAVGSGDMIRFTYYSSSNENQSFLLPDRTIDLNTLKVVVGENFDSPTVTTYQPKEEFSYLDDNSNVYFVEETSEGYYEIYFGDGVLGKSLSDGNVIYVDYIISSGTSPIGAKEFRIVSDVDGTYKTVTVSTLSAASGGSDKESSDSIKFSAPKYFSSQNRAVTYQDYITALQNNNYNFSFDAVNVWGGEDNIPPVYGKVFISLKPKGGYTLTLPEKEFIKTKMLKPINVITVQPELLDPDYVFIKLTIKYIYDKNRTFYNESRLNSSVRNLVYDFASQTLNTFNSTFDLPELMYRINSLNDAILTNECDVYVEKKFTPVESNSNYILDFGCELKKGMLKPNIKSYPAFSLRNPVNYSDVISDVFLEELPLTFSGISEIKVAQSGSGFTNTPEVLIEGDGKNAVAHAVVVNGNIKSIVIDDPGYGYTEAKVTIVGNGFGAKCTAVIEFGIGVIRGYYYVSGVKTVIKKENVNLDFGYIDYKNGIISLKNFNPVAVDNTFGELTLRAVPASGIIYSKGSKLITIDQFYENSVEVNGVAR